MVSLDIGNFIARAFDFSPVLGQGVGVFDDCYGGVRLGMSLLFFLSWALLPKECFLMYDERIRRDFFPFFFRILSREGERQAACLARQWLHRPAKAAGP